MKHAEAANPNFEARACARNKVLLVSNAKSVKGRRLIYQKMHTHTQTHIQALQKNATRHTLSQ